MEGKVDLEGMHAEIMLLSSYGGIMQWMLDVEAMDADSVAEFPWRPRKRK